MRHFKKRSGSTDNHNIDDIDIHEDIQDDEFGDDVQEYDTDVEDTDGDDDDDRATIM